MARQIGGEPMALKDALAHAAAGPLAARPRRLKRDIRTSTNRDMRLRRGIVGLSYVGIASMLPVILYQTGIIRHLPDPPVGNFDSDKVNGSPTAFGYGGPDAPLTVMAHATNIVLASLGGSKRAGVRGWLPVLASLSAGAQAGVAAKYLFHQMPKVDKAWCPYCIADALMHMGTFAFTLPEALRAVRTWLSR
jgi:uncharacterized membrane protein